MVIGEDESFKRENDWSDEGARDGKESSRGEVDHSNEREGEVEDE